MGLETLVTLLITLLVIGVLLYAAKILIDMFPMPPQFRTLIWLILLVVALLYVFRTLGLV